MPIEPFVIDTTIEAIGIREPAWGNLVIIGRDAGGNVADNVLTKCTTLAEVATGFGTDTDIYKAAEMVFAQRAPFLWCIRLKRTDVTNESVTQGTVQTLANVPSAGRPEIRIDDGAIPVVYVYDVPDANGEVNTKTGQIFISGTGTSTVDYSYFDWAGLRQQLEGQDIDCIVLAASPASEQYYGDLAQIQDICDNYNWFTVIMSKHDRTASTIVTDLGKYSSRNVVGIAHKDDTYDVAAAVTGKLSVIEPWDKLMWKQIAGIEPDDYFTKNEVENVLEAGNVNAIIFKQGQNRSSDGLTVAGGDYKYIDTTRTRYYMEDLIRHHLSRALIEGTIPFTASGINMIKSVLEGACEYGVSIGALREPWVDAQGVMQRGYIVEVPNFADVSDTDRLNRILRDVYVTMWFVGHIQSIRLNLAIKL